MQFLLTLVVVAGLIGLVAYFFGYLVERVTVWEHETGVKYRKGHFVGIVETGQYWIFKPRTTIHRIEARPQEFVIQGQEVLSADGVTLKLSVVAKYQMEDAYKALSNSPDYRGSLYTVLQIAAREVIGSRAIDDLLENRQAFDEMLMEHCVNGFAELGTKLLAVKVRDIMFPGDLKRVFAQVVAARKEGQAALERARGETAALRNLANAAKMMNDNPGLLQLRALHTLADSSGNTVVIGLPTKEMPSVISPKSENAKK